MKRSRRRKGKEEKGEEEVGGGGKEESEAGFPGSGLSWSSPASLSSGSSSIQQEGRSSAHCILRGTRSQCMRNTYHNIASHSLAMSS